MEILLYTNQLNSRKYYVFNQVCQRILGFRITFTTKVETFIAFEGAKFSYAKKPLGQELFIEATGLLDEEGFGDFDLKIDYWKGVPCFFKVSQDSSIPFDIFSASFYLLTRYEEYLPFVKDTAGGFPVEESTAFKEDFIKRPVVDLWAYQFLEVLQEKFSMLSSPQRNYTLKLNVAVYEAFAYRNKGFLRQWAGLVNHMVRGDFQLAWQRVVTLLRWEKDPYDVYDELVNFSKTNAIDLRFFFQLSDLSRTNRNIHHQNTQYHRLIKSMGDYFSIGLLPGNEAILADDILKTEKKRWKEIANQELTACLVKRFALSFPDSYVNFNKVFITQDYSMGYPQQLGFRAGTCTSFLFYNLNTEETTPLTICPYIANSSILEMHDVDEIFQELKLIKKDVMKVNGNFSLIFENIDFTNSDTNNLLNHILQLHAND